MRPKLVAGNWKMNTTSATARTLAQAVVQGLAGQTRVAVALCPPAPYLLLVGEVIRGTPVALGAQNAWYEKQGAFTGEISPDMLVDAGCKYVILGHSERRHGFRETNEVISRKVRACLDAGLQVIFCIGETLEERKAGKEHDVLIEQLGSTLAGVVTQADLPRIVLAYEPVWAINTGVNATPEQAQEVAAFLRNLVREKRGEEAAQRLPILYGGSVKPANAADLMNLPDIDGGLIGGASIDANQFLGIVRAVR
jgi:triosephosphate isomerase